MRKFIPMPQAMKSPDAKAAVEKWAKLDKIPAWQLTKVRNTNVVITEARKEGKTVHFASSMDLCHLKSSEGDIVMDDSGSYAVFTEQGSSAKVMDIVSRLPGCAGQAAYTQVKM